MGKEFKQFVQQACVLLLHKSIPLKREPVCASFWSKYTSSRATCLAILKSELKTSDT